MVLNYKKRIFVQRKDMQIQKKGERCPRSCRCGKWVLAAALTAVCLTGCGMQNAAEEPPKSADQLSSETEGNPKSPAIPYSDQIDTIMQNKDTWCFTVPDDERNEDGWNKDGWSELNYYYWITDMDQNGYLEVISSRTAGSDCKFDNHYYEVSQDGQSLTELKTDEREDAPAADLWGKGDFGYGQCGHGYYDEKTDVYHYPQSDHTHDSAVDTSDAQLDTVLADGAVTINTLSFVGVLGYKDYVEKTYYTGERTEKLVEIRIPRDETTEEFTDAKKQESEYDKQLQAQYDQYYEGMQEFTVTSYSFRNIDEKKGDKEEGIRVVSDEILRERVEKSWDSFGIHFPNENAGDNPFFPKASTEDAEVRYLLDMLSAGKATMQIQEELRGEDSVLYRVSYSGPREVSNPEGGAWEAWEGAASEEEEKKWAKKTLKKIYFYLWITDTQIYYISSFYPYGDEEEIEPWGAEIPDDDYLKARLVFYHEIPEYALLVCQEEEIEDALKEGQKGDHQWIEKHGEDIRCYRSYTSKGEDYEGTNILQFVWKRGEGLIGMRSAIHAAGGGSSLFWKEAYLEREDVGFSIDIDTED